MQFDRPAKPNTGGNYLVSDIHQLTLTRLTGHRKKGFDHIRFVTSNAKALASYYVARFGFEPYAYAGLETGSRDVATHVVRQNNVVLAFSTLLQPTGGTVNSEYAAYLGVHG
jgi:uncharacterized protein YqjF (DUF2071 family)